jgi:hypothetical protein
MSNIYAKGVFRNTGGDLGGGMNTAATWRMTRRALAFVLSIGVGIGHSPSCRNPTSGIDFNNTYESKL